MLASRSFPVWLSLSLLLLLAALACNLPGVTQTEEPLPPVGEASATVTLEVANRSGSAICVLYVSPVSQQTWGGNWLNEGGTIPPGASWTAELQPDRYDLMAGDCSNQVLAEEREVDLTVATAYTFTVSGPAAAVESGAGDASTGEQPAGGSDSSGTVTGRICYPSDFIPPMTAYFENIGTGQAHTLAIAENQQQYTISLPPGTYLAYAWLPDGVYGGTFSQAVPCGLGQECSDHTPLPFDVFAGQTTAGIDICDWYGEPSDVPQPPGGW